jgi:hypothetical protein
VGYTIAIRLAHTKEWLPPPSLEVESSKCRAKKKKEKKKKREPPLFLFSFDPPNHSPKRRGSITNEVKQRRKIRYQWQ